MSNLLQYDSAGNESEYLNRLFHKKCGIAKRKKNQIHRALQFSSSSSSCIFLELFFIMLYKIL